MRNKNLEDFKLAFFDVETTGLVPFCSDRICEIGIARCNGFKIEREFNTLVNPQRLISAGAMAVNNITDAMVKDAPLFSEVAGNILELFKDCIIVCHNAQFDLSFLKHELKNAEKPMVTNSIIDTLLIARKHFNYRSNGLSNLSVQLGIEVENTHRALDDVLLTRRILMEFWQKLCKSGVSAEDLIFDFQATEDKDYSAKYVLAPASAEKFISGGQKIHIKYLSCSGEVSERLVSPKQLVKDSSYIYLVGFCHLRNEDRTFRLDRILEYSKKD